MRNLKARFVLFALLLVFALGLSVAAFRRAMGPEIKTLSSADKNANAKIPGEEDSHSPLFLPNIRADNWGFSCEGLDLGYSEKTNYFVSVDGSDSPETPGSAQKPWLTISFAIENVPDNSTIWVGAGQYNGQVKLKGAFTDGVVIRSCHSYQAKLRNSNNIDQVVICFKCRGVTLEGFDIAHSGPDSGIYVIQIQDLLRGENGVEDHVQNIVIRNNVIHDSFNNDLVKINNGARNITVEGNIFYNQQGLDSHLDLNSVQNVIVQDNLFFNDFAGSGRQNLNDTGSFLVIKDSNGDADNILGSSNITVRRNIFFNWEGEPAGNAFISIGEDAKSFYQAFDITIENNLLLGNSSNLMRAGFSIRGSRDISFRNNSIVGNLPSFAYAFRLSKHLLNPQNKDISFYNNIWSDPTGTMGSEDPRDWRETDFSDTLPEDTQSFNIENNLYWNGGQPIFNDREELINITDDSSQLIFNPLFPTQKSLSPPRWQPQSAAFSDGSATIREVFVSIIQNYGIPEADEVVIDQADPRFAPADDILGERRDPIRSSIGALEK